MLRMSKKIQLPISYILVTFFLLAQLFHFSLADVGTAATYSPPYTPTACYGNDASQFPSSNLFAAAGEGIWDNGAACGRQYKVRCISATVPKTCIPNKTIQIRIVDRAQTSTSKPTRAGTTMVLTTTAYGTIANGSPASINIEFQDGLSTPLPPLENASVQKHGVVNLNIVRGVAISVVAMVMKAVVVVVIRRRRQTSATMVTTTAYGTIANGSPASINIEFQEV